MVILCVCTYYKGVEFLKSIKESGNTVFLVTHKKLENKAWPSLDQIFYLEDIENQSSTFETLIKGVAHVFKEHKIDRIVALDDFDVEKATLLREQFRVHGMGQTTGRYFRDKLAMREKAKLENINVPRFTNLFNDLAITDFLKTTDGPWLVKPRSEASATGITKVTNLDNAWEHIHSLGEERSNYLIEEFKPGKVFHVDSLITDGKVVFSWCSEYLNTPLEVAHEGGIFRTITVERKSETEKALKEINESILNGFGIKYGAAHTEVIQNNTTGEYYFLETASRVGGAHIAEMVEAASGINLWREWAAIELKQFNGQAYKLPKTTNNYAGLIISLSKFENPDYSPFNDKEIVWNMNEEYHVGLILKDKKKDKIEALLGKYAGMIVELGYHASAPAPKKTQH